MVEPTNEVGRDTMTKTGRRSGKRHDREKEGKGDMTREEEEGGNDTKKRRGNDKEAEEGETTRRMRRRET